MQSSYQKTAKDTIYIGIAILIQFLVGLVQLPLLTKTLGAYDYGVWAQVQVTVGLILPLSILGLNNAMVRFLAAEKNKKELQEGFYSVVLVILLVNFIVALTVIIFAHPLAMNFFNGTDQIGIVRLTGILILITPVSSIYLMLIRTFQQVRRYSIITVTESCIRVGLIAFLVLNGYGIFSVIVSLLATKALILIILFFLITSQIGIRRPHFLRIKEYLRFGLPIIPASLSFWVIRLSDRYVIGFFLGLTSVGIYSAAFTIGYYSYTIVGVLSFVLLASLSKLYDEGKMNEVKIHLSYSLKYLLTIIIPFAFGAAILAEPILMMFSTEEIASQGHFVTPLAALATLFLGIASIVQFILILTKKTITGATIWTITAALNIGFNMLLVPRMGILGAAITTLFVNFLAMGFIIYYSFKEFKFSINWHFIIKSLVASIIMSLVVWLMAPQGALHTILTVMTGILIYGVILMLLRGFSKEEMRFFWGLFRQSAVR
ncbi:flippase [Chloroflexota bacterium]